MKRAPKSKLAQHWPTIGLVALILVQTVIYALAGVGKVYLHMDEAYSLGLTHYDQIELPENADFYNTWHNAQYYEDYLAVRADERWNFAPVYENQKNDVHPPLYYLLLRLAIETTPGRFSKWPGIILNILIHAGITMLCYLIWRRLLKKEAHADAKALALTVAIALTVASVSSAVYIRMYALLTLMVLLTLWLHLKLIDAKKWRPILLIAVGGGAVLGVLTQYYYLFFLAPLYLVMSIRYVREKNWRRLGIYTGVLVLAGVISLLIWPYSFQHMFASYRGQGVIHSFLNVPVLLQHIWEYIKVVNYNVFHQVGLILMIVLIVMLGLAMKLHKLTPQKDYALHLALWPTLVYFLIVAAASPFIELRYVMPVCGLLFGLVMLLAYRLLGAFGSEKPRNIIMVVLMSVIWLAAPLQLLSGKMRIELLYRDRADVMMEAEQHKDAPLLYLISSKNNRYLDNILPFTIVQESYLALDFDYTDISGLQEILAGKDLSRGLTLWISDQQDHEATLQAVKTATGLENVEYIQTINTCSVYYLR